MSAGLVSASECTQVLEAAIGEVNAIIPDEVLEWAVFYINEYIRLKIEKDWTDCPERIGR